MSLKTDSRIPATRSKILILCAITIATFHVNIRLFSEGEVIRALIVLVLSSLAMITIMKHGYKSE